jgi:hypothetical protein
MNQVANRKFPFDRELVLTFWECRGANGVNIGQLAKADTQSGREA